MAITTLAQGAAIINESLANIGYDYQIDTTSNQTIEAGLREIGAFPPSVLNNIMEQMNLVIQQRNYGVMFDATKNKFREFLVDMNETGFGIEDVFHEILAGTATLWDGNADAQQIAEDLVGYKSQQIDKFFHTKGNSRKFDTTIDTRNYKKVFTPYGVTRYIDTRLANLSWSAEYWFMQRVIDIMRSMVTENKIVMLGNHTLNNKDGINNVVETIKSLVAGFMTPSNQFNKGVYDASNGSWTPVINMTPDESYNFIVTTPEFMSRLKVYGYSNAFNLSQYELEGRILYAPAGTDLGTASNGEKVLALVFDRRSVVVGIKQWLATTFFVANTGWTNHFLNVEILEGFNTIFNAVAITGESVDDFFTDNLGMIVDIGGLIATGDASTDGVNVFGDVYQGCSYIETEHDSGVNIQLDGIAINLSGRLNIMGKTVVTS